MRTAGAIQVVLAVALLTASLAPLAATVDPGGPAPPAPRVAAQSPAPPSSSVPATGNAELPVREFLSARSTDSPRVDREVRVVARVDPGADLPARIEREFGAVDGGTSARRIAGTVSLSKVREFSTLRGVAAVHIDADLEVSDRRTSPGVAAVGADRLHERGIDGENVTVGVVDSGFRLAHPAIADQVGAYRAFSAPGAPVHGTAVAAVVADTAPAAELHLAAVGDEATPAEYRRAVRWLRASGADVVVDAGSYFGQPGDGDGPIAATAADAARDVAVVTSAGNYARRHWSGVDRATAGAGTAGDWVRFGDGAGAAANYVEAGRRLGGRVTVGLRWNGSADYDLYLYRTVRGEDWLMATGTDDRSDADHLSVTVPRGRYYVAVRADDRSGPHGLELFANRPLEHRDPAGSLTAPATAPGVLAVGTVQNGSVAPFSSRGPTADGRRGVDLVAPDGAAVAGADIAGGTSVSAPYVAGSLALLLDAAPDLSPAAARRALLWSAADVGPAGPDAATGYGRLDAAAALRQVRAGNLSTRAPGPGPTDPWR